MPKIKIDSEKCKGCMFCLNVCPKGLIKVGSSLNKKGLKAVEFSAGDCTGCSFCAIICPDTAIEVYK